MYIDKIKNELGVAIETKYDFDNPKERSIYYIVTLNSDQVKLFENSVMANSGGDLKLILDSIVNMISFNYPIDTKDLKSAINYSRPIITFSGNTFVLYCILKDALN